MLWRSSERSIRDSVRNAMQIAAYRKYDSIAIPLISAGSGGGKPEKIIDMIQDELGTIEF